jgi:3-oxoacyl-[acyl-carrier protein] reductase
LDNIIVTGGSRGIGLAIGRRLATDGFRVIAVARQSNEQLVSAQEAVAQTGAGALQFIAFDLSDIALIPNLVRNVRKEFGRVHGLVNNAGIGTDGALANMRDSEIERLIRLNTLSPIVMTKYVVRHMMAEREGRVVNIVSIVASTGYSGLSVYSATKASLVGFTRSLAREVGPLGVSVNAIAPGFVETEMTHGLKGERRDQVVRRSALRRLIDADDVSGAVAFLMGPSAKNVTGTVLTIDAGATA